MNLEIGDKVRIKEYEWIEKNNMQEKRFIYDGGKITTIKGKEKWPSGIYYSVWSSIILYTEDKLEKI